MRKYVTISGFVLFVVLVLGFAYCCYEELIGNGHQKVPHWFWIIALASASNFVISIMLDILFGKI